MTYSPHASEVSFRVHREGQNFSCKFSMFGFQGVPALEAIGQFIEAMYLEFPEPEPEPEPDPDSDA